MAGKNGPSPTKKPAAKRPPAKKPYLEGAAEPLDTLLEQKLTDEERTLKEEAYTRLDLWGAECIAYHESVKECRAIYRLQDPKQKDILQLQTLKSTLNNCIADQIDNTPEALLVPQRTDLTGLATDMNNCLKYIMQINHFKDVHRKRSKDFLVTGTAVTQIMWDEEMDYGKGNISISRFPIESMVWDPASGDVQSCRAIMKLSWHPLSWYVEHYPEQAMYVQDDSTEHNQVGETDTLRNLDGRDGDGRALLLEYWYRRYNASEKRYTINVAYLAGGALLEIYRDVYAHGLYPFVFDVYSEVEGSIVGEGQVHELTSMMRYINRYAHYIDVNAALSSKLRMLVRKGSGINKADLADLDKNLVEGDIIDEDNVRWMDNKPFNGTVTQQMLQFQNDMKMDSGQSQFTRGEVTGGVDAASAIQLLQNAGSKITRLHTQALSDGTMRIVEQVLWLAAEFYKDDRVAMITDSEGQPVTVHLSSDYLMRPKKKEGPLEPPPYTVRIEIVRSNPAAVQAQNDLFIQAYTMAAQARQNFPLSVLFRLLNVDGKEKIIPVLQENETMMQQMQQMAQENQALQQQVASLNETLDGYANLVSSPAGTEDALTAMGGTGNPMA